MGRSSCRAFLLGAMLVVSLLACAHAGNSARRGQDSEAFEEIEESGEEFSEDAAAGREEVMDAESALGEEIQEASGEYTEEQLQDALGEGLDPSDDSLSQATVGRGTAAKIARRRGGGRRKRMHDCVPDCESVCRPDCRKEEADESKCKRECREFCTDDCRDVQRPGDASRLDQEMMEDLQDGQDPLPDTFSNGDLISMMGKTCVPQCLKDCKEDCSGKQAQQNGFSGSAECREDCKKECNVLCAPAGGGKSRVLRSKSSGLFWAAMWVTLLLSVILVGTVTLNRLKMGRGRNPMDNCLRVLGVRGIV